MAVLQAELLASVATEMNQFANDGSFLQQFCEQQPGESAAKPRQGAKEEEREPSDIAPLSSDRCAASWMQSGEPAHTLRCNPAASHNSAQAAGSCGSDQWHAEGSSEQTPHGLGSSFLLCHVCHVIVPARHGGGLIIL